MTVCDRGRSGDVELYFYGELDAATRAGIEAHLLVCSECRLAIDELEVISSALDTRPRIDTPPRADWTAFMDRLDDAVRRERQAGGVRAPGSGTPLGQAPFVWQPREIETASRVMPMASYVAMAALLTIVTASVAYVARETARRPGSQTSTTATAPAAPQPAARPTAPAEMSVVDDADRTVKHGFAALSEQHFERSKLVVLGLANKDARNVGGADWAYERGLASDLLNDTRLYRLAAEERGMKQIAGVMGDLELVLLQTSLADAPDSAALAQIQRLIRKRDLVTKIENGPGF